MQFTIRAGASTASGGFAVIAADAREALNHVRHMLGRGLTDIEVRDPEGTPYDLVELERITSESEASDAR